MQYVGNKDTRKRNEERKTCSSNLIHTSTPKSSLNQVLESTQTTEEIDESYHADDNNISEFSTTPETSPLVENFLADKYMKQLCNDFAISHRKLLSDFFGKKTNMNKDQKQQQKQ